MKQPFQFSERWAAAIFLTGQVFVRLFKGRFYRRKILEHMVTAGPGALLPVLLVTGASGMIFTLQMGRYLSEYNALNALGGAFGEAFCRELAPILTASVVAGQVGSAFAAEIGAMRVTEQLDALQMLRTDPINYLVVPRTIACCLLLDGADVDHFCFNGRLRGGNSDRVSILSSQCRRISRLGANFSFPWGCSCDFV